MEVAIPTTPARSEKITKKPVAIFPIGKYIGNIRAGIDKTDAVGGIIGLHGKDRKSVV